MNNAAAFVCKHVARSGLPILYACLDEPVDSVDSGWQFVCGVHEEIEAEIWAVANVIRIDPSIEELLSFEDTPAVYVRDSASSPWERIE